MPALVLDAGPLIAVDRNDRAMMAKLRIALQSDRDLWTIGPVIAQVWRTDSGRHALLARLLRSVYVIPVDEALGKAAGILLGKARTSDAVDGILVAVARPGDQILTGDPSDIGRLVSVSGRAVAIVAC